MIKKLLLFTLCLSTFTASVAQSKMNFALAKKVQETQNRDLVVDVFIQGNIEIIKELVTSTGGTFKYSAGNIAAVSITIQQLAAIITNKAVRRIEAYPPTIYPFNDSSNLQTNVLPVHAGTAPLRPQGYFGDNVVLGFIDTGIDITHPDFIDALGHTRIKYIWDHKATPVSPPTVPSYTYGIEWDSTAIQNGLCTHVDNPAFTGHGTHVVGRAAGNGLATGQYLGAAPNVDIIMVALDFTATARATAVTDAIQYIYAKALAAGKPCVINGSFGSDFGSHDGYDLESQMISALIDQNPGQAFVAAAGNSGNKAFHLSYTVTADTNFTLFAKAGSGVYLQMWADTNDFKNVDFAIGADQIVPTHSFRGRTAFHSIATMPVGVVVDDTVWNNGNRIGKMQMFLDSSAIPGVYSLDIQLVPDTAAYYWRLTTKGSGTFDLWNFNNSTGVATAIIGYQGTGLPSLATMPDSIYYKQPDKNKTISTGFQCLDNVIAVANYTDRKSYTQYNGTPCADATCNTVVPGKRVISSAIGPTRDGRIKPDIAAPGDMALAAAEVNYRNGLIGSGNTVTLGQGGMHNRNGGSSHASPAVAGIAALYLQKNPTATAAQVKNAIISCTIQDEWTGCLLPDNYWGYGKVNAFGALTEILTTTHPRDTSVCEGSNATFTAVASGTGLSYQWVIEQNDTCVNLNNVAPYSGVTTNTLTITGVTSALSGSQYRCIASNAYACDITSDSAILSVNPLPTVTATSSASTVCAGDMLTLTGAGATTYTLTGGAVSGTPFVSPAVPTTYTVIGTDGNGCKDTTTIGIQINALPAVTANASANTVCVGASITLTGSGAATYAWAGGHTNGVGFVPAVGLNTYTVTGTDINSCTNSATVSVMVNFLPTVTANASANTVCIGGTATLTGGGASTYVWTGGITDATSFTPALGSVTYTVTGTDINNCVNSDETTITTIALPIVTSSGLDANYCIDAASVTLTGTPAGGTFSGTGITSGVAGTFDPVTAGSGTLTITYTYTDGNNCTGISTQSTTVLTPAVSADSCPTLIPPGMDSNVSNIFTPNNDGINDEFKVSYNGAPASDFNLSIYNRWGILVFTSNNPYVKWDGHTTSGIKVSAGTYFYVLVNAGINYKGYIALFD